MLEKISDLNCVQTIKILIFHNRGIKIRSIVRILNNYLGREIYMKAVAVLRQTVLGIFFLCGLLLAVSFPVRAEEEGSAAEEEELYNLLLIGSDRRDESWNGNSDVVMLLTINDNTQKIILTSFMRDLYADIPGYGSNKLNYAYAAGGAPTLVATLEDNYNLQIDNYAAVDFDSMAEIVDLLGGVDMNVTDEEVSVTNDYLVSMDQSDLLLTEGGFQHLNGYQAVAYMRVRYVGDSDYDRTARQRSVLSELFVNLKGESAAELTDLAQQVLALTDSDISAIDLLNLLGSVTDIMNYTLVENRIPYDGLYSSENEMLVPDYPATIDRLYDTLLN